MPYSCLSLQMSPMGWSRITQRSSLSTILMRSPRSLLFLRRSVNCQQSLPCPSHQGMGTGVGEHGERRPALHWSLALCLVPASFFHLPSSGSWLCLSASSSLSPSVSFLPSQLRCPLSSERETHGVSVARDGVGKEETGNKVNGRKESEA